MKQIVGIGFACLMSLQAYAQDAAPTPTSKLTMRMRLDSLNQNVETKKDDFTTTAGKFTAGTTTKSGKSGFKLVKSDITFNNKMGETTVQVRLAPYVSSWSQETPVVGGSGLANVLDQFWVEQPLFLEDLKLKAGKLEYPLYAGGIERIVATSYDYYIKSYMNSTYWSANPLGFSLAYTVSKQKFEIQVDNGLPTEATLVNNKAATAQSYDTDGGLAVGFGYFGDFGWVKPVVTYSQIKYAQNIYVLNDASGNSQTDFHKNEGATSYSVGGVFSAVGASIMAEYDALTIKGFQTVLNGATATSDDTTVNTIVLDARYPISVFTPFIKLTSDNKKQGDNKLAQTAYSVGCWYNLTPTGRLDFDYDNTVRVVDATSTAAKTTTTTTNYIIGTSLKI